MKKTALALASAMLLLTACGTDSTTGANAGGAGAGSGAPGTGSGVLGMDAQGNNVGDRVFFALDSSVVDSEGQGTLERQAAWLKANPNVNITLEGHADERGTREYNLALGERRANSVANYLVALGVDKARLSTISYGKERPLCTESDESCWSQNRRGVSAINQ